MLRYEPIGARHVPLVEPMLDDADVLRFTGVPDPAPAGFAEQWLGRYVAARADGTKEGFAAFFEDDGALAGLALAPVIDPEGREMELGYMVPAPARGRGAATAMLRWLTRWAFEERGALRV
ncbi:MAG: GNAT family N-acetyltransferase, partial [Solirubrobacterales bacterium]|nr:GNAT family N-acetyltransferase [Solirubrobacterales bacterium]